jgi:ribosome-binding factor A
MSRRKASRPQRAPLCADLHEDDGIDPRVYFKREEHGQDNRKTQQLCKQVMRTLGLVLAGECSDTVLSDLEIQSVTPSPDSSRLLVRVQPTAPVANVPPGQILTRLQRAQPFLRREVTAALCRKRSPDLAFEVVPHQEVQS